MIFFAALLIVLLYAGVSYYNFRKLVAAGVDTANKAVAFERTKPGADMRILLAGDSTVVGTGVVDPKTSTAGYFGAEYPDAEIINLGKNGRRISELLELFKEKKAALGKLDIIVFQIGGNDITHFTPLKDVERDVTELLREAREIAPKVVILHTGDLGRSPIFPWPINWIITHRTKQVRQIYLRATAATQTHYVDLLNAHVSDEFALDPKRFYAVDNFHLSGEGYGIWYREIKKVLKAIQ